MRKTLNTIKILGMKKDGSEFWYYIIEDNGNENWVIRDYMITHYPVTLCEFYESRIVFDNS